MSGYAQARPAGHAGPLPYELEDWRWADRRYHPPLPVKILAIVAAFWLFHPLGVALLVYVLWRAARRHGGCGFRGGSSAGNSDETVRAARSSRPSSRNTAFEERRRETLKALDEEAEAFDGYARKRREAEDREAFERFMADRAPKSDDPR